MPLACADSPDPGHAPLPGVWLSPVLRAHLEPLLPLLAPEGVTELVINRPGEVGVESRGAWEFVALPGLSAGWLTSLAVAAAAATGQELSSTRPLCSFALDHVWGPDRPGDLRGQAILPPASATGAPLLALRKPAARPFSLKDFAILTGPAAPPTAGSPSIGRALSAAHRTRDWETFFFLAVRSRISILISGATGSGKTSFAQALVEMIPAHERLVTIEDARELRPRLRNVAPLLYAKDRQGPGEVTPGQLLEAALRLRPDRILFQELRDAAAWTYLRQALSGHPGGLPTIHADSTEAALVQLALLVREAPAGRALTGDELSHLIRSSLPIGVHLERRGGRPAVVEVRLDLA